MCINDKSCAVYSFFHENAQQENLCMIQTFYSRGNLKVSASKLL